MSVPMQSSTSGTVAGAASTSSASAVSQSQPGADSQNNVIRWSFSVAEIARVTTMQSTPKDITTEIRNDATIGSKHVSYFKLSTPYNLNIEEETFEEISVQNLLKDWEAAGFTDGDRKPFLTVTWPKAGPRPPHDIDQGVGKIFQYNKVDIPDVSMVDPASLHSSDLSAFTMLPGFGMLEHEHNAEFKAKKVEAYVDGFPKDEVEIYVAGEGSMRFEVKDGGIGKLLRCL